MKKNTHFLIVFVVLGAGFWRGVYRVFYHDTSIDTSVTKNLVLPAEEIQIDTNLELSPTLEVKNNSLLTGDDSPSGMLSVSDRREFPTIEINSSLVVNELDAPWAFAFLPNGNILITERFGVLKLFANGTLTNIDGIPEVYDGGQGGLLDVIAHPRHNENQLIYISYVTGNQESNSLSVARGRLDDNSLENLEVIFEVEQKKSGTSHFGSRFAWLPDETLVFSVGDGGNPPITYEGSLIREQAQNLSAHLGKIIRIGDDGAIPQNNPYIGREDVEPEIYSYGHRNIQGIAYDINSQSIFASEHGSKGGDELNQIISGENYGRPLVSYATEYDALGTPITDAQSLQGFIDPLVVWTPTIAPSAVISYNGDQYGEREGDIFVTAMLLRSNNSISAYASSPAGAVLRLDRDNTGKVISQERLYIGDVRVRSIHQGPDGYIYVLTDDTGPQNSSGKDTGKIIKLTR